VVERLARGRLCVAVLLTVLGATLTGACSADARWGKESCSLETHCYDLQGWEMEGGSESVKGAQFYGTTNLMNIQEYSVGRVSNELWLAFDDKYGGWFETGQLAGDDNMANCCTLHPFIARSKKADLSGYEEYIWTLVNAEPTNLYTIEDPSANGDWCTIIWYTNQGCYSNSSYWSVYSDDLEAGIEATSNDTQPENSGSQEVNAFTHAGAHIEWKGAKTHAEKELKNMNGEPLPSGVMCQTPRTTQAISTATQTGGSADEEAIRNVQYQTRCSRRVSSCLRLCRSGERCPRGVEWRD
jgi:hypothetical protein